MQRNNWYLPSLKSSIISQEYIEGVRKGTIYCPKYSDLKPKPCPDPPTKEYLLNELVRITTEKGKDIGASDNKVPDRNWLISVLAIFAPTHLIFKKDYLPPVPDTKKEEKVVDN